MQHISEILDRAVGELIIISAAQSKQAEEDISEAIDRLIVNLRKQGMITPPAQSVKAFAIDCKIPPKRSQAEKKLKERARSQRLPLSNRFRQTDEL